MPRKKVNWVAVKSFYLHAIGSKTEACQATLKEFGLSRSGLWKHAGAEDWERLRNQHQQEISLEQSRIVDFKAIETKGRTPGQQRRDRLTMVDGAIEGISSALSKIDYAELRAAAGGANALVRLLEYRKTIAPSTTHELIDAAIAAGIEPKEFIEQFTRTYCQG
ncbi:MAG: hypothetical protein AAGJ80_00010 [Cyanobacteria bacterium J06553_1]